MQPPRFSGLEDIDRALRADEFLLFKHSDRCPTSARAFAEYVAFHAAHPNVPTAWIDVVAERPWSQHVAKVTGVAHESPQALLVRHARVVWNASHGDVTKKAMETMLGMPPGLGGG